MPATVAPLPVASASGVRLRLEDGRELIDGMASWWCAIHGYRHPVLDQAVRDQLDRMAHVMFGGLTHEPAVTLATRLVEMTGLEHVFFADSGSVSVEVAMKMCRQARPGRTRFLTVRGGYHGDTLSPHERVRPRRRDAPPVPRGARASTSSPTAPSRSWRTATPSTSSPW